MTASGPDSNADNNTLGRGRICELGAGPSERGVVPALAAIVPAELVVCIGAAYAADLDPSLARAQGVGVLLGDLRVRRRSGNRLCRRVEDALEGRLDDGGSPVQVPW